MKMERRATKVARTSQNYEGYDLSEESDRSRGVHGSEMRDREGEVRDDVGVGTSDLVGNIVSQNRTTCLPNRGMATSSSCNKPAAPLYFRRSYSFSFSNDATKSRSAGSSVLLRRKLQAVRKHRVNYTMVKRRQEDSRKIVPSVSEGLHVTTRQSTRPHSNVLRDMGDLQAPLGSPDSGIRE
jgi:hypothetical protein